ncbi:serine hydrolase domain-containing protein [Chryseobacterium sp. c4a]|uniref:serine hydrolase domain-containing protein n=1 Tax=Chryseobacterium sp. c4a TaxID=1573582 RepID=UPI0013596055|nr:serine hydrolase domain-containing protein [Chryseobacterium sp. c4a]
MKKFTFLFLIIVNALHAQQAKVDQFSAALDSIRSQLKIPGMSVAVKQDDVVILQRGYGFSDLEKHIPATPETTFRVASVTKTFTSTLVMQLVEQGKLKLDDPAQKYGINLNDSRITVKHLLTHTSEEVPGTHFQYNGYRFGLLGTILEKVSGIPFYRLLTENILIPLTMTSSAPCITPKQVKEYTSINPAVLPFFITTFDRLAKPYELTSSREINRIEYLNEFGAFGGLATSVGDLLKYSDAIDRHQLISEKSQKLVFTPNETNTGSLIPYGLGWFVQSYKGREYYWHYGQTNGESALFVKVPYLKLTLAVMCNTDKLSQPFPLGDGDLMMSPVGSLFYHYFIDHNKHPDHDLENKELISKASIALLNGDTVKAQKLYEIYSKKNKFTTTIIPRGKMIAEIQKVGINKNLNRSFTLPKSTSIKVLGTGENCSGNGTSWCDYGWIEDRSGKMVWQMQNQPSSHAGGALKNQKVNQVIILPEGKYTLHYQSDSGHAYNHWDSLPPDGFFWGITLQKVDQYTTP